MSWALCPMGSSVIVLFSLLPIPLLAGHDGNDLPVRMFDDIDENGNVSGPHLP